MTNAWPGGYPTSSDRMTGPPASPWPVAAPLSAWRPRTLTRAATAEVQHVRCSRAAFGVVFHRTLRRAAATTVGAALRGDSDKPSRRKAAPTTNQAVERGCRRSFTRWLADDRLRRYVRAPGSVGPQGNEVHTWILLMLASRDGHSLVSVFVKRIRAILLQSFTASLA